MVFWACVPFANKRVDREFGKVERSSINEITLYRSIISPKSIPSLPPFSRTLPFISFVRARGVTSLFEIPTTAIPTNCRLIISFPTRHVSIFPDFNSRPDKSFQVSNRPSVFLRLFFFFSFRKLGDLNGKRLVFRARFDFQFSILPRGVWRDSKFFAS